MGNTDSQKNLGMKASYKTPAVLLIQSSLIKVFAVIEERKHLRKK